MEDKHTQDDGLPSVTALSTFDMALEEMSRGLSSLMSDTCWAAFGGGISTPVIGPHYDDIYHALSALREVRSKFKISAMLVTVEKVVRV
jgi:hypothetical protein